MRVKFIEDEDFTNYKVPAMFIGTISCGGKCCLEAGIPLEVCQNDGWRKSAPVEIPDEELCKRYLNNPITSAMIFGGLEPMEQIKEVVGLIETLRRKYKCGDAVVIYTGYYPNEIKPEISALSQLRNIVVKYGRFIPNSRHRFDEVLGVELSSENQYAERIS